jgi:hypothetical protein
MLSAKTGEPQKPEEPSSPKFTLPPRELDIIIGTLRWQKK